MTLTEAYSRKISAQRYLQSIAHPYGPFSKEERADRITKARLAYQKAEADYRKIAEEA